MLPPAPWRPGGIWVVWVHLIDHPEGTIVLADKYSWSRAVVGSPIRSHEKITNAKTLPWHLFASVILSVQDRLSVSSLLILYCRVFLLVFYFLEHQVLLVRSSFQ